VAYLVAVGFIVPPALYWGTREEERKTLARGGARESFAERCAGRDEVHPPLLTPHVRGG
jgi:hypothetical protein